MYLVCFIRIEKMQLTWIDKPVVMVDLFSIDSGVSLRFPNNPFLKDRKDRY